MRHAEVVINITCKLDEKHFGPWENLSPERRAVFDHHKTLCDGCGQLGPWCSDCHFCHEYEIIDIEEESDGT